ncbi:MAG: hypothetical protein ACXWQR_24365 [Ktedonobacterales bacterium]
MDAEAVLATARSGNVPSSWFVWPLRRDYVLRSALGWSVAALFGFLLFIPACIATLPILPQRGVAGIIFTIFLLLVLGALAFGGAGIAIYDLYRLRHAEDYFIVLTPDVFIKAEPRKVIEVPLEYVGDITMRGVKTPDEERETSTALMRSGILGNMFGTGRSRKEPGNYPSLAFVDQRTEKVVVVSTDQSFESLIALEQILSDTVRAKQRQRTH